MPDDFFLSGGRTETPREFPMREKSFGELVAPVVPIILVTIVGAVLFKKNPFVRMVLIVAAGIFMVALFATIIRVASALFLLGRAMCNS